MGRSWTEAQLNAINAKGGALIVSAAAGSGKTAVLVERVIRRICDESNPTELNRLLIVTYTTAAAAEMRERIGAAIAEKLKNDPQNPFLLRQQALLPRANISTIDSFCSNIVRENFYLLKLADNFRIADSGELALIKADALKITLDRFYKSENPDFYRLAEAFSTSKNDSNLENLITSIYDFLCSHPFGGKWLKKMLSNYDDTDEISATVWGKTILTYAENAVEYTLSLCKKGLSLAESDTTLFAALNDYLNIYIAMLEAIKAKLSESASWDEIRFAVLAFDAPAFPRIKGYKDHPTKLIIHENQKTVNEAMKKLSAFFAFDSDEIRGQLSYLRPVINQMFACVEEFTREFDSIKRRKGIADFCDLEHWTLSLLVNETENGYELSEFSKQLSERFDEVMVDEYQDANEVQDAIFRAVSDDNKHLFVVGDVKQSIYSFRQAMPEIFLERKENSEIYSADNPSFPAAVILDKNFRSRSEITDTVNFIFKRLMSKDVGDIEYNDSEALKAGAIYPPAVAPCVDFMLIDTVKCGQEDSNTAEASAIAEKILKMIHDGVTVTRAGKECPIEYGDIAILMRSPNKNAPTFSAVLRAYGIPVSCEKTENFFDSREVRALLNLLRVVSNPMQDIPLAAVLMSPIFGFTSDDIAEIRANSPKTALYSAVLSAAENQRLACCERLREFLRCISEIRAYSITVSIGELVNYIFDVLGFAAVMNAAEDSSAVSDNLRLFCEYAAVYEKNGRHGLSAFLNYIDRLNENNYQLAGAASTTASDMNTVKIMSIHKSKGLEFPVCILANTSKKFNMTDLRQKVLINSHLGIAAKIYNSEHFCYLPSMPHNALGLELRRGLCSEELRVLYVALTRARERLIITSAVKSAEKEIIKAASMIVDSQIPPFNVQACESYGAWLLMCALLHPNAHEWRKTAQLEDYEIPLDENIPCWNFETVTSLSDKEDSVYAEALMPEENLPQSDVDLLTTLRRYADFSYPLEAIENLPLKVSASELAHSKFRHTLRPDLSVPAFLKQEKSTAAQKGTSVHKFLQVCDFKLAKENIGAEIDRLINTGRLSENDADAVREKNLSAFFASPLVEEIINSPEVLREYTFMVSVDAALIEPDIQPPFDKRSVVMQGSVDLAYLDKNGEFVIVDYKTDRISRLDDLTERYKIQLDLYKNALEQSTCRRVSKCILYSIHLNDSIRA